MNRRNFLKAVLAVGGAGVAAPALTFLPHIDFVPRGTPTITGIYEDMHQRLDLEGGPWQVYWQKDLGATAYYFCVLVDQEPTETKLRELRSEAVKAFNVALKKTRHV